MLIVVGQPAYSSATMVANGVVLAFSLLAGSIAYILVNSAIAPSAGKEDASMGKASTASIAQEDEEA